MMFERFVKGVSRVSEGCAKGFRRVCEGCMKVL